jgi:hypothetical protein
MQAAEKQELRAELRVTDLIWFELARALQWT